MYRRFDTELMDDLFYDVAPLQALYYANEFDVFEDDWDTVDDPNVVFRGQQQRVSATSSHQNLPPVGHVEVANKDNRNNRNSRRESLAELRQHHRDGWTARTGQRVSALPDGNAGLAVVNNDGSVTYTILDPSLQNVVWHGSLGTLRPREGAEEGTRRLLNQASRVNQQNQQNFPMQQRASGRGGQGTRNKKSNDPGPDILPDQNHAAQLQAQWAGSASTQTRSTQTSSAQGQHLTQTRSQQAHSAQAQRSLAQARSQQTRSTQRQRSHWSRSLPSRSVQPQSQQRRLSRQGNRFDAFTEFF